MDHILDKSRKLAPNSLLAGYVELQRTSSRVRIAKLDLHPPLNLTTPFPR